MFSNFLRYFLPSTTSKNDWVIIANGPSVPVELLQETIQGKQVMALDGSVDKLIQWKIHPQVILGDFDSIKNRDYWGIVETVDELQNHVEPYTGRQGSLIVPVINQDQTDLEKGIIYCDKQQATSIIILNAIGERVDHTLGNLGVLRKYHNPNRPISIQTATQQIEYAKNTTLTLQGQVGDECAIIGFPEATMNTDGLVYEGSNYQLKLGLQESICNKLAKTSASVEIKGEAIVIGPLIKSQLQNLAIK